MILPIARRELNDAFDFLKVVCDAIDQGMLARGDTLVLDNARVHDSVDIAEILLETLRSNAIDIRFLPAYSPEVF